MTEEFTSDATGSAAPATTTRRAVFAGAGAVGATALLTACGDDTPAATGPTGGATPGADTSSGPAAPKSGTVIGRITDVPVGGGKIFPEQVVVVTQPSAGVFAGFSAICTHQQCVLSSVSDGKINCACHGSAFDVTSGAPLSPPATKELDPVKIVVKGEEIQFE